MLLLQLLVDGLINGLAIGLVAISFSLVYATTRVFHVAHAGIYTLGGYIAWYVVDRGWPFAVACIVAVAGSAVAGALLQKHVYEPLKERRASPLVLLIASLGALAVLQNLVAVIFTPNLLQFAVSWRTQLVSFGPIALSYVQVLIATASTITFAGLLWTSRRTALGRRIRAVASNPLFAEIARLRPRRVAVQVMMIASAIVALSGVLVGLDQAIQPYTGTVVLLTASVAMIAGGIGSLTGAFVVSIALAVLQNLSLLVMPGRWSIAVTFGLFIFFMIARPEGLFRAR